MEQSFQGKTSEEETEETAEALVAQGKVLFREAANAYRNTGTLKILTDPKRALELYIKSSELDPTNPGVWEALVIVYTILGETAAATAARKEMEARKLQELKNIPK
ncbi:MAG: hypothetical protein A3G11_02455 [Candidatus Lloydbacteria bacterium RIFCSPLOWO2_12_FULL_51_9]|nr:MAG: hypothetical protein A3G11_02455 [Candidatus Lloydbacteria bacterium RIFCSPLOWO2_12_FULL_51_9]